MKMNAKSSSLLWTLSIFVLSNSVVHSFSATMPGAGGRDRSDVEFGHHHDHSQGSKTGARCEEVTIPMCKDMPYNKTILPNLMGHATQEEAGYEVHQYYALVKVQCSPSLKIFLCSLFSPFCNILHEPLPPCRSLCEAVRNGCEHVLLTFGLPWPDYFDCSRFPLHNELCVNGDIPPQILPPAGSNDSYSHHAIPTTDSPRGYSPQHLSCPSDWSDPEHSISSVGHELQECGPPCSIFTPHQKQVASYVVGVVASVTLISSLFTVFTAILDPTRFHYPDRAIVHIAVCYVGLGVCYIIGAFGSSEISCSKGFIVLGPGSASCTLLFMFTYFLTFSSHIWWVLLSLTWYLSAGLTWGGEAIADYSLYFHLSAWGISAFVTMASVALGYVEGDPLAGPCSLGVQRSTELQYFMMFPLIALIVIGTIFFVLGFFGLFRIRGEIKRSSTIMSTASDKVFVGSAGGQRSLLGWDQQHQNITSEQPSRRGPAAGFEILMARIGVFSVFFLLTSLAFLVALFYISTPLSEGGVLMPIIGSQSHRDNQLLFIMYLVRYIANLGFGCALIIWVLSWKTLMTWKRAICGPTVNK
ncbi:frizzled-1 [Folsomia candida]|uniref:Frizzled-1 n=1 Tax=Folsomia candida TaxID=158441 RepID=A0A226ERX2_FOLCA|nr:frizzled-1 [Folsomia candida]OXA60000.1 Frizzled-1 [Folsomia candida]